MPAIKDSLIAREAFSHIAKRSNWASENVGVMVVFCIVGVVGIGMIFFFVSKQLAARRNRAQSA